MDNILITDSDYKHALGAVRSLGRENHKIFVVARKKNSFCSKSKYCHKEIVLPGYTEKSFKEELLTCLSSNNIDVLMPVGANSFKHLVPLKKEIEKNTAAKMVSVEDDKLNLCLSKERTYRYAQNINIPVPVSFYPRNTGEVPGISDRVTYPCVIKGKYDVGYNVVAYAHSPADLLEKYDRLCKRYNLFAGEQLPLIQEYITGDGYGFFAVYNKGKCGSTFQHHRLREMPPSGGYSVAAESAKNRSVHEYGKKLLSALNWHGVAMVEFKVNPEGVPVLMEINPKFWGSLDLALEAGVNFPLDLVRIAGGEDIEYSENYKFPFRCHWPCDGDLEHAFINPKKCLAVIKDCVNPRVKSNLWFGRDPRMTWFQFLFMFKRLAVRIRNKIRSNR
ncbi:MAG: ATP-grasp domain-containing protein [Candidatus Aminicenantes bacterium]|nr:ATP-grasp domain-containing protein [Candidatus Aminicenantes bacterium]